MSASVIHCKWCRNVIVTPGRGDDHLTVMVAGDVVRAVLNAVDLIVQDGVCIPCAKKIAARCKHCGHAHAGAVCLFSVHEADRRRPCHCAAESFEAMP